MTESQAALSERGRGQVEGAGPGRRLRLRRAARQDSARQDSARQDSARQDSARQDGASWRESAACRFLETDLFFPIGKTGLAVAEIQRAKAVCAACPVREPCLTFALDTHQGYGIWGGYDEDERRVMLRQRRKA